MRSRNVEYMSKKHDIFGNVMSLLLICIFVSISDAAVVHDKNVNRVNYGCVFQYRDSVRIIGDYWLSTFLVEIPVFELSDQNMLRIGKSIRGDQVASNSSNRLAHSEVSMNV